MAQGGAQGIEDGCAIGLVMYGVTDPSQIPERLAAYQKARYNRASFIQIASNYGLDDHVQSELANYLEDREMPSKSILFSLNEVSQEHCVNLASFRERYGHGSRQLQPRCREEGHYRHACPRRP